MRQALIIDDEVNSQELLATMLHDYCEGIAVCGMAGTVQAGIDQIQQQQPDLVFLDMELSGGDGFDVMDAFPEPDFEIVVVSGYNPHLLRQLNYAALAYLSKPIILQELQELLGRLPALPTLPMQVELARQDPDQHPERLILAQTGGYASVALREIAFIEAQRTYSRIVLEEGGEHMASHPLKYYEELLPNRQFFRIHKSFLLNLSLVQEYDRGRTGFVRLRNGAQLPIAARRKADFIRSLKNAS